MLPIRKSIRLKGYDYSSHGFYFVTICTSHRKPLLGVINYDTTVPSASGKIVLKEWRALPSQFPNVRLDVFQLMPDHMHFILQIETCNGTPLSQMIRTFKSSATREINVRRGTCGSKVWQDRFNDHIIRNERELNMIRLYIRLNPLMRTKGTRLGEVVDWTDEKIAEILNDIQMQRV